MNFKNLTIGQALLGLVAVVLVIGGIWWGISALRGGDVPAQASIELVGGYVDPETGLYQNDTVAVINGKAVPKKASAPTKPEKPATNDSEVETGEPASTGGSDEPEVNPEPEPVKGKKLVLKLSNFKDWVNGELNIKDTDIAEISVFGSKKAAQDFLEEYSWNNKHDFSWNFDEFALFVANDYGESDPAPAVFFSTTIAYFVVLSSDGVTADFYELNTKKKESGELVEKKSGEKSVYAVDQLETDAS